MCGAKHQSLPEGLQRVAWVLRDKGHAHAPHLLDGACGTAQPADDTLGVAFRQIANSMIFRRESDDVAVLVVTSSDRRVDEENGEALVGKLRRADADADFVKAKTGFSVGCVSPFAHTTPVLTVIDRELFRFAEIRAAAGHPRALVRLRPQELEGLAGAQMEDVE